jgi:hypothetical protein
MTTNVNHVQRRIWGALGGKELTLYSFSSAACVPSLRWMIVQSVPVRNLTTNASLHNQETCRSADHVGGRPASPQLAKPEPLSARR